MPMFTKRLNQKTRMVASSPASSCHRHIRDWMVVCNHSDDAPAASGSGLHVPAIPTDTPVPLPAVALEPSSEPDPDDLDLEPAPIDHTHNGIILKPHVSAGYSLGKDWEVRTRACRIRQPGDTISMLSGCKADDDGSLGWRISHTASWVGCAPTTAHQVCNEFVSHTRVSMADLEDVFSANGRLLDDDTPLYVWKLENITTLEFPLFIPIKRGQQTWVIYKDSDIQTFRFMRAFVPVAHLPPVPVNVDPVLALLAAVDDLGSIDAHADHLDLDTDSHDGDVDLDDPYIARVDSVAEMLPI